MSNTHAPPPSPAITARPMEIAADPGPLGLACFALTTFVLSVFNAGLLPAKAEPVVFGLALFYGGAVQIIAGVMEYFRNNTFGATAFCSYGAFWMSFWYLATQTGQMKAGVDPAVWGQGVGVFLLGWTIFTAYMFIAVLRVNGGLTITFAVLLLAFICLTAGDLTGNKTFTVIGGWFGLAAAFAAWYCSFAGVLASTAKRPILPVWPRSA